MIKNAEVMLREIKMLGRYRKDIIESDDNLKDIMADIEGVLKGERQVTIGGLRDARDVVESKLSGMDDEGTEDMKFILMNHIETIIEECVVEEIVDKLINDVDDERLERAILNKVKLVKLEMKEARQ